MTKSRRRSSKNNQQDKRPVHGSLRIITPVLPPGIITEQYEISDLRNYDGSNESTIKTHVVNVWITRRDQVIDVWLNAERILRTACVVLLSTDPNLQPRIWALMERQSGAALIDLLADLLTSKGHTIPSDFRDSLKALARLRNILAHQASRPRESLNSDGIVFLRVDGFNAGRYIEVPYIQMDEVIKAVDPVMRWLVTEIPGSDGVSVSMDEDIFDRLDKQASDN